MSTPKFKLSSTYKPKDGDLILLFYENDKSALFALKQIPAAVKKVLGVPAKPGARTTAYRGEIEGKAILAQCVRLDKAFSNPRLEAKKAVASAFGLAKSQECKRIVIPLSQQKDEFVLPCHEGVLLGGYRYDEFLSEKPQLAEVIVVTPKSAGYQTKLRAREVIYECQNFARDVLNEPPNELKPPQLANKFKKFGGEHGLKVEVWDEKRLEREQCGGVLAVGMGSDAKPRMVIADYKPTTARAQRPRGGVHMPPDTPQSPCLSGASGSRV